MLNLKKTAVAVLALGSSAVFAGTMGPVCAPGNVTVPCEKMAWDVGGQALYLQPTFNPNFLNTEPTTATEGASQPWGWGFQIEGSYHFNTGNDINANWYHLNNAQSYNVDGLNYGVVRPSWDAVNVEMGQLVEFGDMKSIRFHGGVQYGRVRTGVQMIEPTDPLASGGAWDVTYNGFGPRFGADMRYGLGNGFGIYGKAATAILAGTTSNSISSYLGSAYTANSATAIIPEVEGKLGIDYTAALAMGDLTMDIGWMWVNYFNVAQPNPNYNDYFVYTFSQQDFGLQGLYFGMKWLGNI